MPGNQVANSGNIARINNINSCIKTYGAAPLYISVVNTLEGATPLK